VRFNYTGEGQSNVSGDLGMVFKRVNPIAAILELLPPTAIGTALALKYGGNSLVDAAFTQSAASRRYAKAMAWAAGSDPLVLDLDGDLFAQRTGWLKGDGKISTADAVWAELQVWQDRDGDGIMHDGELVQAARLSVNQSRSAASMRVCHPVPLARNCSTTSRDRRMVIRSLVTSAFGRPRNLDLSANGKASKRSAFATSFAVHSGLSASMRSGSILAGLLIPFHLSFIGLPETDNADTSLALSKNQRMDPPMHQTQGLPALLSIIVTIINPVKRGGKIKIGYVIKSQSPLHQILEAFVRAEADTHSNICMYTNYICQVGVFRHAVNENKFSECAQRHSACSVYGVRQVIDIKHIKMVNANDDDFCARAKAVMYM
jgi:hypothetical protein